MQLSNLTILVSHFNRFVFNCFEKLLPREPDSALKSNIFSCVISLTLYGSPFIFGSTKD
jgi:hypothetical protein